MAKLDWEKQNRSDLIVQRLQQHFDEEIVDLSKHQILLKDCGFPPSLEATQVVDTSWAELRRATKELRLTVDRNTDLQRDQKQKLKAFLDNELKDAYTQLAVLRLVALYPFKLGIDSGPHD